VLTYFTSQLVYIPILACATKQQYTA
jgi:hypothetical protein